MCDDKIDLVKKNFILILYKKKYIPYEILNNIYNNLISNKDYGFNKPLLNKFFKINKYKITVQKFIECALIFNRLKDIMYNINLIILDDNNDNNDINKKIKKKYEKLFMYIVKDLYHTFDEIINRCYYPRGFDFDEVPETSISINIFTSFPISKIFNNIKYENTYLLIEDIKIENIILKIFTKPNIKNYKLFYYIYHLKNTLKILKKKNDYLINFVEYKIKNYYFFKQKKRVIKKLLKNHLKILNNIQDYINDLYRDLKYNLNIDSEETKDILLNKINYFFNYL